MRHRTATGIGVGVAGILLAYPLYLGSLFAPADGEFGELFGVLFAEAFGTLGALVLVVAVDASYRETPLRPRRGAALGLSAVVVYGVYGWLASPVVRALGVPYFGAIPVAGKPGGVFLELLLASLFPVGIAVARGDWRALAVLVVGLFGVLGAGVLAQDPSFLVAPVALLVADTLLGVPFLGVAVVAAFPTVGYAAAGTGGTTPVADG